MTIVATSVQVILHEQGKQLSQYPNNRGLFSCYISGKSSIAIYRE